VQYLFGGEVSMIGEFGVVKQAEVVLPTAKSNAGAPLTIPLAPPDAREPAGVVAVDCSVVPDLGVCRFAQIADAVAGFNAFAMVDLIDRPAAARQRPDDAVRYRPVCEPIES
jgi:hypothetical protein